MRIGIVAPCWFEIPPVAYGGIEWVCAWLVDGLVDRGHDVTLIGAGADKTKAKFISTFKEPPSAKLGEPVPEVLYAAMAGRILKDLNLDIVHDHTLAGPLLALGRATPTVVTAHGPVSGDIGAYFSELRDSIQLVAISDAQRQDAPGLPWAGRVYNGIPVAEYPFQPEKQDYSLFLGRMSPEKGADLAIDASREAGLPIVLAGKRIEPLEKAFFQNFVAPKLEDDTHWIGQVGPERKKDLLGKARCLVFPIRWKEPFGIVMVEALACGTPVVALNNGSVPEVISHGETGYIVDDPEDLAEAIMMADQIDPAACRRRALKFFDTAAMVEGYEAIFQGLIKPA